MSNSAPIATALARSIWRNHVPLGRDFDHVDDETGSAAALTFARLPGGAAANVIHAQANSLAPPAGTDRTLTIPRSYTLHKGDFGFSDVDGNGFKAVVVTALPSAGTLYYDANGALGGGRSAVVAGQVISAADIAAGKLTYLAPAGASGANYDHFTFQVRDDSNAGGLDTDQSPNSLTFDLVATPAVPTTFGSLLKLGELPATNGFKIQGVGVHAYTGVSVSGAGDVNGDGFADFIVGTRANASYLIFGKAGGFPSLVDLGALSTADGFKIVGESADDGAGLSVSGAGDVNGDGFADILVGASGNDGGGGNAGAAYVIFGHAGGFGAQLDLSSVSAATGFKIEGAANFDAAGYSVASAGDINGDGFADVIVGAFRNYNNAGAAYVIFGRASGFSSPIDLGNLPASVGFKIRGEATQNYAGKTVSSAGDVNGDGYDDLIVGSYGNSSGGLRAGAAYVIFGHAGGFGSQINLANLSAAVGFKIQGPAASAQVGISVSSAGDINGDGFADVVVGSLAPGGIAYVIFGKASGFASPVDLANLSAASGFKIQSLDSNYSTNIKVSAAGDFNGDGLPDFLVGVPADTGGGRNAGAAYLIYGKVGGFGTLVDLPHLAVSEGFKIQGQTAGDGAGYSVSAAGDVNGDGYADIIVGAEFSNGGTNYAGAAYVIYGRPGPTIGTPNADVLTGTATGDVIYGLGGDDTLIGNGGNDLLAGGLGNDIYRADDSGDIISEAVGEGSDVVYAAVSYALTAGSEIEVLSAIDLNATTPLTLVGNEFANVIIGNAGANTLIGGGGNDTLIGGAGNDIYRADDSGDIVREAVGGGSDVIYAAVSYSLGAGSEIEVLSAIDTSATTPLTLIGNEFANIIIGNAGANTLIGGAGNDTLIGGGGNDIYRADDSGDIIREAVGEGSDVVYATVSYALGTGSEIEVLSALDTGSTTGLTLVGNEFANIIIGTAGNDTLIGGAGNDQLFGGAGNDVYRADDSGDVIREAVGGGSDVVYATVSYSLGQGSEIEVLSALDTNSTTGLTLIGNEFANIAIGTAGGDTLIGGAGNDQLFGGAGNDVYRADDSGDIIREAMGGGSDVVYALTSYSLGQGSEIEALIAIDPNATDAYRLAGNEFANVIRGNAGANVIDGGAGSDVLAGLGGADTFQFTTALGANNVDVIIDFTSGTDKLSLDHNVFTGLAAGALAAGAFVNGTAAQDADDRILYDAATGNLYFDADGNGAGAAVLFANLQSHPAISAADIIIA